MGGGSMAEELITEKVIAILGGDRREESLLPELVASGFAVRVFGLPGELLTEDVVLCERPEEAVSGADVILLPLAGVNGEGYLYAPFMPPTVIDERVLAKATVGIPVIAGVASEYLRRVCEDCGAELYEVAELDEIALPNAVLTAEGALLVTMQETDISIDGMTALVLGFGRVGSALAERLKSLGARVTVVNRGGERLKSARAKGYRAYPLSWLWEEESRLSGFDVVYNTIPAVMLGREELLRLRGNAGGNTLILDLASGQGGVDWEAAEEIGLRALHLPGLPGKVAPVSAGKILGRAYPEIINRILAENKFLGNRFDENKADVREAVEGR